MPVQPENGWHKGKRPYTNAANVQIQSNRQLALNYALILSFEKFRKENIQFNSCRYFPLPETVLDEPTPCRQNCWRLALYTCEVSPWLRDQRNWFQSRYQPHFSYVSTLSSTQSFFLKAKDSVFSTIVRLF